MFLDNSLVWLAGALNPVLERVAFMRQEPCDLIGAGPRFTANAADVVYGLTNSVLVAAHGGLPYRSPRTV
jgi:hypothetical protein